MEFKLTTTAQDKEDLFDINKHINNYRELIAKKKEKMVIDCLRTSAIPPIKGEITKGKIRWRGIKFYEQGNYIWIAQRGKRISPKWDKLETNELSNYRQHTDGINSNTVS